MVGSIKGWISVLFRGAGGNGSIGRDFVGGKLESSSSIKIPSVAFVASLVLVLVSSLCAEIAMARKK